MMMSNRMNCVSALAGVLLAVAFPAAAQMGPPKASETAKAGSAQFQARPGDAKRNASILLLTETVGWADPAVQTIVFIRHGEKPNGGLGQLTCQGLNRALALPAVIARMFGKPDAIFAPNPSVPKRDEGKPYYYVRPLATVEPTAIAFGLPVDVSIGAFDTDGLRAALEDPLYRTKLILVAWEHHEIETMARILLTSHGGDVSAIPSWEDDDFDSIYLVKIFQSEDAAKAIFERERENLDGQSVKCPP
jgi:hypothetical protein